MMMAKIMRRMVTMFQDRKNHEDQDDKLLSFQGFKLKMDDMGNILIKRLSKSPVYARNTLEVNICC